MTQRSDLLDLGTLGLTAGEGRRLELAIPIGSLDLAGQRYAADPAVVGAVLDVSRMTGNGYALRLRFTAELAGPCMRCLERAGPQLQVDAREVDQPGDGEELDSPYMKGTVLDLAAWAHDAFALAAPDQVLCRLDCLGLCPQCAANLNEVGPGHGHESAPDPRWAKLRELRFE